MATEINLDELRRLSAETGFSSKLLEKDYHLTKMLQKISEKKYLESVSSGSTRSTINLIDVKDIEITIPDADILNKFEPFGVGNPMPRYLAKKLKVHNIENVGNDGKHVRMHVIHNSGVIRKVIGFSCSEIWI